MKKSAKPKATNDEAPERAAGLIPLVDKTFDHLRDVWEGPALEPSLRRIGRVTTVSDGVCVVSGLSGAKSEELVRFRGNHFGLIFNVDESECGVVLLDTTEAVHVHSEVRRTNRVLDVPVGRGLLGRVVNPLGQPLDGGGALTTEERLPIERPALGVFDRAPVERSLETGIKPVDALIPVGKGQRELILGDRQTGKTAIALDTIIHQKDKNVICIYCAVGQRATAVAKAIAALKKHDAIAHTIVVVASGSDPSGLQYVCPFAAMSMAEFLMAEGEDVLVVFDDLTRHAQAYRELSLLLRRPPGREAFPGDIFYLHARLLERATRRCDELGGGSITALPIVETEAQNLSAYIPTNLISITDGQIYLSPLLFHKGILPAVDIGRSVSRVGGKAQLPAFRSFAGELRLSYSQFEELEMFTRFGTRLEADSLATLEHGKRVREILKQPQYSPLEIVDQILILLVTAAGLMDQVPLDRIRDAEQSLIDKLPLHLGDLYSQIRDGDDLDDDAQETILKAARPLLQPYQAQT